MPFADLRAFLDRVEAVDRLQRVEGAHWDLEIGGITELTARRPDLPALLFDDIPGYPRGYRVLTHMVNSRRRCALVASSSSTRTRSIIFPPTLPPSAASPEQTFRGSR